MSSYPFGMTPKFSLWVSGNEEFAARLVRVEGWASIVGGEAYVVRHGLVIRHGVVETTTADESIAWVSPAGTEARQLVDKADDHELWIAPRQLQHAPAGGEL